MTAPGGTRHLYVACTSGGPPLGPPIRFVGDRIYGYEKPFLLGSMATHCRAGVAWRGDWGEDRIWLDAAQPRAHLSADWAYPAQVTWELLCTGDDLDRGVSKLLSLDGTPYDSAELIEQGIPFLANHGGVDGAEICSSLSCLVLLAVGGQAAAWACAFLRGARHPERFLRAMVAAEPLAFARRLG